MYIAKFIFDAKSGAGKVVECPILPVDEQAPPKETSLPTIEERLAAMEAALIALMGG